MQPGDETITPLKRPSSGPTMQYPNPRRLEFDETVRTETPEMIMDVGTDSPDVEVDQQESARPVRNRRKPARFNDYVLTQQSFSRHERLGGGVGYSGQIVKRFREFGHNIGRTEALRKQNWKCFLNGEPPFLQDRKRTGSEFDNGSHTQLVVERACQT